MARMVLRSNGASSSFLFGLGLLVLLWVGSMRPFVEKNLSSSGFLSNVVAAEKLRLGAKNFAHDFIHQNITYGAQEYDSIVYWVEEDYLGIFDVDFDITFDHYVAYNANNAFTSYADIWTDDSWDGDLNAVASGSISIPWFAAKNCTGSLNVDLDIIFDHYVAYNANNAFKSYADTWANDSWDCDLNAVALGSISFPWFAAKNCNSGVDNRCDFLWIAAAYLVAFILQSGADLWLWVVPARLKKLILSKSSSCSFLIFWVFFLALCTPVAAVTCHSCFDGIAGCTGGADCLFATRTAANLAALTVAGGAAINVVSLLPTSYVRHLPTQVLRTLAAIARVPVAAGPPDMGAMTLNELQESLTGGRIDSTMYKAELSARLADPATAAAQVARISAMLMATQSQTVVANTRSIDGINSYGVLGYLVAAASLIVNSGKRTYSSGTTAAGSSSSSSGSSTLSIRVPTSGSQFAELLMVWQTLAHAVGAANILATVPFLQQIVWDGISTLGLLWEQAYCLFLIYLEAIEDSQGALNVANVFAAGAQDTRLKAANQRYSEVFACHPCDDQEDKDKDGGKAAKKWNNKDSPNATGICKTYNFKDAEHPKQHLYKDGTCKFRHVCIQWVTGKGAGGMCEGNHPKYACTNPNKTNIKPTQ